MSTSDWEDEADCSGGTWGSPPTPPKRSENIWIRCAYCTTVSNIALGNCKNCGAPLAEKDAV